MSFELYSVAKRARTGSHVRKCVLLCLAEAAGPDGVAYVSIPRLALDAECSTGSARVAIHVLYGQGHISIEQRSGFTSVYHVHPVLPPEGDVDQGSRETARGAT